MTAQAKFAESMRDTHSLFRIRPVGTHTRVAVDSAVTITAPTGGNILIMQAEGGTLRYTLDGTTTPTATLGFRLGTTDGERRIDLAGLSPSVIVIGESTGFFVNYQWFSPVV